MASFPDETIRRQIETLWPELKSIPEQKQSRIAQLKTLLTREAQPKADPSQGRALFEQACASCHTLFGTGGKIGPDLTGAQRSNLDYLLENIVDPAATVSNDFHMSTVALADGRILSGIVSDQGGPTLAIQTPTERLVVRRDDVEEIQTSAQSLMPDGLLDTLNADQIRNLMDYLMSPSQVPLPESAERQ